MGAKEYLAENDFVDIILSFEFEVTGDKRIGHARGRSIRECPAFAKRALEIQGLFDTLPSVSPTIFRYRQYRFFFFSREEPRIHVHVFSPDGEAKFWLEPQIELAVSKGLRTVELAELRRIIEERQDEIREHWHRHFRA